MLTIVFTFEYNILKFFESIRTPFLNKLFIGITKFGSFDFYIIVIPALFFIVKEKKAYRVLFRLIFSYIVNTLLKNTFKLPRPSEEKLEVLFKESGPGYGFPSGHAQNSMVFWLSLYTEFGGRILLLIGIVATLLISLSRLYLGVHFFMDVVGGLAIGLIVLFLYILILQKPLDRISEGKKSITIPISVGLLIISFFNPFSMGTLLSSISGLILGTGVSSELNYEMKRGTIPLILRIVIGVGGLILIRYELKVVLGDTFYINIIRYFIMGLWITFISKLLFKPLKI